MAQDNEIPSKLVAHIQNASNTEELKSILSSIPLQEVRNFVQDQVMHMKPSKRRHIFYQAASINTSMHRDVIQLILQFCDFRQGRANRLVCKLWNDIETRNEYCMLREMYRMVDTQYNLYAHLDTPSDDTQDDTDSVYDSDATVNFSDSETVSESDSATSSACEYLEDVDAGPKIWIWHGIRKRMLVLEKELGFAGMIKCWDDLKRCSSGDTVLVHSGIHTWSKFLRLPSRRRFRVIGLPYCGRTRPNVCVASPFIVRSRVELINLRITAWRDLTVQAARRSSDVSELVLHECEVRLRHNKSFKIEAASSVQMRNCNIHHVHEGDISAWSAAIVVDRGTRAVKVQNCIIGACHAAIFIKNVANPQLKSEPITLEVKDTQFEGVRNYAVLDDMRHNVVYDMRDNVTRKCGSVVKPNQAVRAMTYVDAQGDWLYVHPFGSTEYSKFLITQ